MFIPFPETICTVLSCKQNNPTRANCTSTEALQLNISMSQWRSCEEHGLMDYTNQPRKYFGLQRLKPQQYFTWGVRENTITWTLCVAGDSLHFFRFIMEWPTEVSRNMISMIFWPWYNGGPECNLFFWPICINITFTTTLSLFLNVGFLLRKGVKLSCISHGKVFECYEIRFSLVNNAKIKISARDAICWGNVL